MEKYENHRGTYGIWKLLRSIYVTDQWMLDFLKPSKIILGQFELQRLYLLLKEVFQALEIILVEFLNPRFGF